MGAELLRSGVWAKEKGRNITQFSADLCRVAEQLRPGGGWLKCQVC